MRILTRGEELKIRALTENSVSVALLELTQTGIEKSIMDATGPVRNYLKKNGFHDYNEQRQGPESKVLLETSIILDYSLARSKASLYRPMTKKGDPRIWFAGLKQFVEPSDIIAILGHEGKLYVFNLTQLPLNELLNSSIINPIKELIEEIGSKATAVSLELLGLLRKVASRGPIKSSVNADTAVGRTLESALGIDINSSKKPDYKGIELKSFRDKKGNRKTLFAQVADWNLSKFKGSSEILDAFGYPKDTEYKRLNCTVSAIVTNSQGLSFVIDDEGPKTHLPALTFTY